MSTDFYVMAKAIQKKLPLVGTSEWYQLVPKRGKTPKYGTRVPLGHIIAVLKILSKIEILK